MSTTEKKETATYIWRAFVTIIMTGCFTGIVQLCKWGYEDHVKVTINTGIIKELVIYKAETNANFVAINKTVPSLNLYYIYPVK